MVDIRSNPNNSYEMWVKNLNRNTKFSSDSKIKPQAPSSQIQDSKKNMKRERKLTTSEMWLG